MDNTLEFTTTEAAFILREPVKAVRKALDEGPVRARLVRAAGAPVRTIGWSDLFYLYAIRALRDELTPKARADFHHALKQGRWDGVSDVTFGRLTVRVADLRSEIGARARELAELADKVEFRVDGEAVLKGTTIEVHRIAALLDGGLSVDEVREDYPSLDLTDIETAGRYAEAYPKPGRPYPRTTVKRALKGAGLEALDEMLDAEFESR
jgi:uncharacterized protein (DUF433 family)